MLAKIHQGETPTLTFERELEPFQRLVIRLWHSSFAGRATDSVWLGMVAREHLTRAAGIVTLVRTNQDSAASTGQFAQVLQTRDVLIDTKQWDGFALLLL